MRGVIWYLRSRPHQVVSWLSRGLNVFFLAGEANETTSSRAFRLSGESRFWDLLRRLIDLLFLPIETDHCRRTFAGRAERAEITLRLAEQLLGAQGDE